IWGFAGTRIQSSFQAHPGDVWSVAFSPDGKLLATADGDADHPGTVSLWDTANWRQRATLPHPAAVLSVAFAPDGRTLATGSWDRKVRLWPLADLGRWPR